MSARGTILLILEYANAIVAFISASCANLLMVVAAIASIVLTALEGRMREETRR